MYVVTHKGFNCPDIDGYTPIFVGKKENNIDNFLTDDTGINIAEKNKNYCELTAKYWIWKNDQDSDIVGISHYRRYFTKKNMFFKNTKYFITSKDIIKYLKYYDIILPKLEIYKETAYEQYCIDSGFSEDLEKVRNILEDKYPQYVLYFDKVMAGNKMHQFNMMICKKEVFDKYCEWLFNIFSILEKQVDFCRYNDYQKRIFGFLSERLLNVWVYSNNLKIKQVNVVNTEVKLKDLVRLQLRRIKNEVLFLYKYRVIKRIEVKNEKS